MRAYPLHVVGAWIGNTPKIAQKHYLSMTDDMFKRAAGQDIGHPPFAKSNQHQSKGDIIDAETAETADWRGEFAESVASTPDSRART